jgi:hypothetical protein
LRRRGRRRHLLHLTREVLDGVQHLGRELRKERVEIFVAGDGGVGELSGHALLVGAGAGAGAVARIDVDGLGLLLGGRRDREADALDLGGLCGLGRVRRLRQDRGG